MAGDKASQRIREGRWTSKQGRAGPGRAGWQAKHPPRSTQQNAHSPQWFSSAHGTQPTVAWQTAHSTQWISTAHSPQPLQPRLPPTLTVACLKRAAPAQNQQAQGALGWPGTCSKPAAGGQRHRHGRLVTQAGGPRVVGHLLKPSCRGAEARAVGVHSVIRSDLPPFQSPS